MIPPQWLAVAPPPVVLRSSSHLPRVAARRVVACGKASQTKGVERHQGAHDRCMHVTRCLPRCHGVCRISMHETRSDCVVVHACKCCCEPCCEQWKAAASGKRWCQETPKCGCGGGGRVRNRVTVVRDVGACSRNLGRLQACLNHACMHILADCAPFYNCMHTCAGVQGAGAQAGGAGAQAGAAGGVGPFRGKLVCVPSQTQNLGKKMSILKKMVSNFRNGPPNSGGSEYKKWSLGGKNEVCLWPAWSQKGSRGSSVGCQVRWLRDTHDNDECECMSRTRDETADWKHPAWKSPFF